MTPLHLQMLLHYYAIAEPYAKNDPLHAESRAVSRYRDQLVSLKLIHEDPTSGSGYSCTERGFAYVEALKALPLPEVFTEWKIPSVK